MTTAQEQTPGSQGALTGLKVIDLSRVLGGPFAGQILGDHGADVIKVEPPAGDETRAWGPPFRDETASYFLGLNRNKRGIALDLRRDEGRDALLRLLDGADVLLENFKTGTMEKWGLGYDVLSQKFPGLIHCRVTGFGADGPMGGMPGYDAILQAMGGIMSVNGTPDSGPTRVGLPVVDMVTGLNAVLAITMALHHRHATGQGQFVEAALFDSAISLLHPHAANYALSGRAQALEAALAETDGAELADRLIRAGVPAGPVLNVEEALAHPHTHHREMRVEIDEYQGLGAPAKLSGTAATFRRKPPGFAEHTEEVLREAGYDEEDIRALRDLGVAPTKPSA